MNPSSIPLYGRAWKFSVTLADSSVVVLSQSQFDPESLRLTFDVLETTLPSPWWFADITLYNLNKASLQNLLFNARWATLEAGYQSGPSKASIIWDGPVLQVLYTRENVVDLAMKFNCLAGPSFIEDQFLNKPYPPGASQLDLVSQWINQLGGNVDQQVSQKAQQILAGNVFPRGKTVFGNVNKFIFDMADSNFLTSWIRGNQQYMSELYSAGPGTAVAPDIVFGPPLPPGSTLTKSDTSQVTRSIVGVPKQSQFGAIFEVLLDPRIKVKLPPMLLQLDNAIIQQLKIQYGQIITPLDKSGLFVAGQVRHYGDTRGNDWYTEVTGYTPKYAQGLLDGTYVAQTGASN